MFPLLWCSPGGDLSQGGLQLAAGGSLSSSAIEDKSPVCEAKIMASWLLLTAAGRCTAPEVISAKGPYTGQQGNL